MAEAVSASLVHAPAARRLAAAAVDGTIIAFVGLIAYVPAAVVAARSTTEGPTTGAAVAFWMAFGGLVVLAAWLALVFLKASRATPGMALAQTRLVAASTGVSVGFVRTLGRALLWHLGVAVIVGAFSPLMDARLRGWHDKLMGTMMVDATTANGPLVERSVPTAAAEGRRDNPGARERPGPTAKESDAMDEPLITAVPGFKREPAPQQSLPPVEPPGAEAAPVPPSAVHAPVVTDPPPVDVPLAAPVTELTDDEDLDLTRIATPRTVIVTLTWDDGTVSTIGTSAVVGRNPESPGEPSALLVSMPDPTKSLSKTHFSVRIESDRVEIVDLHSTNGVALARAGASQRLEPGEPYDLADGDLLSMGERTVTIGWR
ncbi:MAG: hypothetical protein CVT64_03195 [Actinobacteria bacterium HGW-Actinobacteria-4]|nr:MAG: hypothetical protein CVT64_03195 [Actinobacteria bacterium HGW-Actinobacteria-4]